MQFTRSLHSIVSKPHLLRPSTRALSSAPGSGPVLPSLGNDHSAASATDPANFSSSDGLVDAAVLASQKVLEAGDPLMSSLGNSPVDIVVKLLDSLHHTAGLEWWAAIAVGTLAVRFAMMPMMLDSARNSNRFILAKPHLDDISAAMKAHPEKKEEQAVKFKKIADVTGFKFYKMFLPLVIQAPIYSSLFFATKRMAETHPSMMSGGTSWITDLSVTDPYYVLPVLAGALMIGSVELGAAQLQDNPNGKQMQMMMRGLGFMIVPVAATMPASVGVYFVASGIGGFTQSLLFKTSTFKVWTEAPVPGVTPVKLDLGFDAPPVSDETDSKTETPAPAAAFAPTDSETTQRSEEEAIAAADAAAFAATDVDAAVVKSNRRQASAAAAADVNSSRRPDMMKVVHRS